LGALYALRAFQEQKKGGGGGGGGGGAHQKIKKTQKKTF